MTESEKRAFNAGLEQAAEIAQPAYRKQNPGMWSQNRIDLARKIRDCKLEIVSA